MTLTDGTDVSMEMEPEIKAEQKPEKPRKRRLERDAEIEAEEADAFDFDGLPSSRRGRKEGRRVSGVYREIRSLRSIGHNSEVMTLVLSRMPIHQMMTAGCASPMWLTLAYHILRQRLGNSSFVRMYQSEYESRFLWLNWELHFHDQLLAMGGVETYPEIQAIISVGNRTAYDQLIHEDAKLPYRQEHIFAICQNAIMTTSDLACIGTATNTYSTSSMIMGSLFIPKSDHFTMKAFGLELSKDAWTAKDVQDKVLLFEGDLGANQTLTALLLIKYSDMDSLKSFVGQFTEQYSSSQLLAGDAEEVGCNRIGKLDYPAAVGFAFYTGPGATVAVYEMSLVTDDSGALLEKMKAQVDAKKNSLCFMFSHDTRSLVDHQEDGMMEDDDWSCGAHPEPSIEKVLTEFQKWLPRTPVVGLKSLCPVTAKTCIGNSNVVEESTQRFTFTAILLTYN